MAEQLNASQITPSIAPRSYSRLPDTIQNYYRTLSSYEAPFLQEKLAVSGAMPNPAEYSEAFTEFKKFVSLAKMYGKPVAMPSKRVDEVWHQFILFTREYHDFCNQFVGRYFHHEPNIPSRVAHGTQSLDNLVILYTQTFGDMPAIWELSPVGSGPQENIQHGSKTGALETRVTP